MTVSVFGRAVPGGTEYRGSLREEEWGLAVTVAGDGAWETWDAAVCANATQPRGCLVTEAASNSFLEDIFNKLWGPVKAHDPLLDCKKPFSRVFWPFSSYVDFQ